VADRKRLQPDPAPHALTDEERAYIRDRLLSASHVPARLVRKMLRVGDERLVKLQRIERLVKQARQRPDKYPGSHVASFVEDILSGRGC
jgi:hypothetical protein